MKTAAWLGVAALVVVAGCAAVEPTRTTESLLAYALGG
jgi:hypothetical protein